MSKMSATELASAISGIMVTLPPNRISNAIIMSTWPNESQLLISVDFEVSPRDPSGRPRAFSMQPSTVALEGLEFKWAPLVWFQVCCRWSLTKLYVTSLNNHGPILVRSVWITYSVIGRRAASATRRMWFINRGCWHADHLNKTPDQDRPTLKPISSTVCPGFRRPFATASLSAIGIVADTVLPINSWLTNTLSTSRDINRIILSITNLLAWWKTNRSIWSMLSSVRARSL